MAIVDRTNPIEQMREAWVSALDELVNSTDNNHLVLHRIIELVDELRRSTQLTQLQPKRMVTMCWDSIRGSDTEMYNAVMTMATVFSLELDSVYGAIEHFIRAAIPYDPKSSIVDKATLDRTPSISELDQVLKENVWLFMLMFGATQFRVTNRFMIGAGLKAAESKKR